MQCLFITDQLLPVFASGRQLADHGKQGIELPLQVVPQAAGLVQEGAIFAFRIATGREEPPGIHRQGRCVFIFKWEQIMQLSTYKLNIVESREKYNPELVVVIEPFDLM